MTEHELDYDLERGDDVFELLIAYTITTYDSGRTYGPPENCYPPEGGEIESLEAFWNGQPFPLTASEYPRIEAFIHDNHDFASEDYDEF